METRSNSIQIWYSEDGIEHREDGPSYISSDYQEWTQHGARHRIDGPARMWSNGTTQYWVNDCQITNPEITKLMTGDPEDMLVLKLKYGYF